MFNPREWARKAREAGMKYFVITTKHHEGFCLWDTKYTDYKATNTPYGKDLLHPMVDAFRAEGLKIGFYHSLLDWHHPDYTVDRCHPMRENEDYIAKDAERKLERYVEYLYNQTRELMTEFGKVAILWYDFSVAPSDRFPGKGKDVWHSEELLKLIRSYQPDILINDRLQIDQDIKTPEQYQPRTWLTVNGKPVVWEACQTFSGSWGYHRDESTWKSPEMLIRMLVNTVSCGGNLLMNVGPTARGEFDPRAKKALGVFETWMHYNSRSIYNCTMAEPDLLKCLPPDCRFTQSEDGKRLYVHLFAYPFGHLLLPGMAGRVAYAQFLHDASEIRMTEGKVEHFSEGAANGNDLLVLNLPPVKPDSTVPVIELFLK
jgi:alpha-L-fucosidase